MTGGNHDFAFEPAAAEGDGLFRNAFYKDELEIDKKWELIPPDTDVLTTHTPPKDILDLPNRVLHGIGCPHLHCFGYVHAGYGETVFGGIEFINASLARSDPNRMRQPIELSFL